MDGKFPRLSSNVQLEVKNMCNMKKCANRKYKKTNVENKKWKGMYIK